MLTSEPRNQHTFVLHGILHDSKNLPSYIFSILQAYYLNGNNSQATMHEYNYYY